MNRRNLVAAECRYLAPALPGLIVTGGSLRFLLQQPGEAVPDHPVACFPTQTDANILTTSTPLPKED